MHSVTATFRNGRLELTEQMDWPEGMRVEVTPIGAVDRGDQGARKLPRETYRDLIRRLAGSFGDEPFERPPQGDFDWSERFENRRDLS